MQNKTLDLREKAKELKPVEKSPHVLKLGDDVDDNPRATLASVSDASFPLPEISLPALDIPASASHSESLRDFHKVPFMPASFHPDPVAWEGYLHGHNPDLARVGIFILALLGASLLSFFYSGNIVTGFLFLSMIGALVAHVFRDKELGGFRVDELGVTIHGTLHKYKEIESFWIDYHPEADIKELSLHLSKTFHPYLKVPLHDADPVQIRRLMLHYLPEVEHKPNFADAISRHLRI